MALENAYAVGQQVRLTVTFTVSAAATDPTTVTLKVKDPAGTITTYTYAGSTITKSGTGVYYKDLALSSSGTWYYGFTGTGTCAAASEGKVFAKPTDLA